MTYWKTGRRLAATFVFAIAAASCDHASTPMEAGSPQEQVGEPQELLGLLGPTTVRATDPSGAIRTYELIREPILGLDLTNLRVSSLIGVNGGTITLLGHRLVVPRGAVDVPTLFTMIVLPTGYVQVDVTALQGVIGSLINIGEEGFNAPVRLDLTYERATNVRDARRLTILRLNPAGLGAVHEALPTTVDTRNKRATVWLEHFSGYCMAQ